MRGIVTPLSLLRLGVGAVSRACASHIRGFLPNPEGIQAAHQLPWPPPDRYYTLLPTTRKHHNLLLPPLSPL
jgi:hypothetical protein